MHASFRLIQSVDILLSEPHGTRQYGTNRIHKSNLDRKRDREQVDLVEIRMGHLDLLLAYLSGPIFILMSPMLPLYPPYCTQCQVCPNGGNKTIHGV